MRCVSATTTVVLVLIWGCGRAMSGAPVAAEIQPAAEADREQGLADFPGLTGDDWPWWRGPTRNGIAAPGQTPPVEWNANKNIVWKAPLAGRGHSSPIVVGNRVFVATADESAQVQSVVALDRASGQQVWSTEVSRGGFPRAIHPKNTHASPTIACDGERLFVVFVHDQGVHLTALNLEGKPVWQNRLGPFDPRRYEYGYGPSPMLYRKLVVLASEHDGESFLVALDRASGEEAWRTPRQQTITYSPPVVTLLAGRDQLLISGSHQVSSYDPASGTLLWSTPATTAATCGTIVWDGDLVFASGGYPDAGTYGIRGDGSAHVVWQNNQKCYEQSMLAHDGHLYALTDGGVLFCWRAADGKEMWRERLRGPVSASPVFAGGHIYQANERGTLYVFKPNPQQCELVAENQLGDESFASPAICGNQVFLRVAENGRNGRQEFLYCIGK